MRGLLAGGFWGIVVGGFLISGAALWLDRRAGDRRAEEEAEPVASAAEAPQQQPRGSEGAEGETGAPDAPALPPAIDLAALLERQGAEAAREHPAAAPEGGPAQQTPARLPDGAAVPVAPDAPAQPPLRQISAGGAPSVPPPAAPAVEKPLSVSAPADRPISPASDRAALDGAAVLPPSSPGFGKALRSVAAAPAPPAAPRPGTWVPARTPTPQPRWAVEDPAAAHLRPQDLEPAVAGAVPRAGEGPPVVAERPAGAGPVPWASGSPVGLAAAGHGVPGGMTVPGDPAAQRTAAPVQLASLAAAAPQPAPAAMPLGLAARAGTSFQDRAGPGADRVEGARMAFLFDLTEGGDTGLPDWARSVVEAGGGADSGTAGREVLLEIPVFSGREALRAFAEELSRMPSVGLFVPSGRGLAEEGMRQDLVNIVRTTGHALVLSAESRGALAGEARQVAPASGVVYAVLDDPDAIPAQLDRALRRAERDGGVILQVAGGAAVVAAIGDWLAAREGTDLAVVPVSAVLR